ncbi:hypothetical protein ACPV6E_00790 [Corynebacterium propinquum]|uniref:Uncharacterized protein n=1 Tax=Corynebacterium propinquum TaxID=43769 RepID=A0AAP4BRK8_9CORY|nr:hypothetical protein [Corynebacterium propinquum]MDK4239793.1 hypothetical protein [Corynebacterium propinquum]MDK4251854.1 hypothetical protein [Corynebacterium propinquum]MDK4319493.1 hypothetical protein [Corynebacterium propinquum]MDK4325062.1 hypothetical protein [Corynebacterium propinquum]QQU86046.1 hypothetical protein I6I70_10335 [Corynebacterium propinquum]
MSQTVDKECAWLEAISVFQQLRKGNYQAGVDALCPHKGAGVKGEGVEGTGVEGAKLAGQSEYSQNEQQEIAHGLMRMLAILLRGEDQQKLDDFVDVALGMAPPPRS